MSESPAAYAEPPSAPPRREFRLPQAADVPGVTYAIVAITVAIYLLQLASVWLIGLPPGGGMDWLEYFGARVNSLIRAGQVWRFFTPALLHASPPHILFNMYALGSFGGSLERQLGHGRFLTLYILSAFAGNVLSFFLAGDGGYSVGASTAVFGLVAAEGVFLYQNRRLFARQFGRAIGNIIFIVVINLALGGLAAGIDNWGHIGGLMGGLIFTWFAGPLLELEGQYPDLKLIDRREWRDVITGAGAVILIFGALAVAGIVAPIMR